MTARVDLEGIVLSHVSQTQTNTVRSPFSMRSKPKQTKLRDTENRSVVASGVGEGGGEKDEGRQKRQTRRGKRDKCWG